MAHDNLENGETSVNMPTEKTQSRIWSSSNRGEDVVDGGPFMDQMDNASIGNQSNEMSLRKNYAYHLLDIALLMANVSQLKAVLDIGESYRYYKLMMGLTTSSIIVQILLSIILLVISAYEKDIKTSRSSPSTSSCAGPRDYPKHVYFLDHLSVFLVVAVIVINAFISAFGFDLAQK